MTSKVSSINLYDQETKLTKFDIEVHDTKVDITVDGSQKLVLHPQVELVDAVNGNITNLSQKVADIEQSIINEANGAASASSLVQSNLDAYQASNDAALATLNNTVVSNKAISDANHSSDAQSRTDLKNDLETKITAEETRALLAEGVLTTSLNTEVSNRTTAVSDEKTRAIAVETGLSSEISTERGRVDAILNGSSVDLDTFQEVVNNYQSLNTDALAQITALTTRVSDLEATVATLTA